jgi:hypothetical protein
MADGITPALKRLTELGLLDLNKLDKKSKLFPALKNYAPAGSILPEAPPEQAPSTE